ncbi:alpha/beta hydrolase domain-containing protein [Mycobacterium sp. URHB0044]|uniref:alpha/beta hydrolase domain-containing protein n=1 Tax=Mycobacterium sp. URHB0044 TaxID=1380386 RepID=UPI000684F1C8|nr:alpha/beta hydrolase domain-containing protein [Mycobacterium sp. URHB0044]
MSNTQRVTTPAVTHVPGTPNLLLGAYAVADVGYAMEEFFVSGTATSYDPAGATADYTTRIVVLTPSDPTRFNGTVLVEWVNVSGGIDAPAVWFMAHREIIRAGYAYVAVSAQRVGVEGGGASITGFDMSLKTQDAQRYGTLEHPGDAYAYDIFSQIGQLIRDRPGDVLGESRPEAVVAIGESQSAMFLSTYVNAVDPLAKTYDGFLVHSRFGEAAPLDGTSILDAGEPEATPFTDELRVPVMTVITETDLVDGVRVGYHRARRPDANTLRTWEIPGTAHADNYTIKVGFIDSGSAPLADLVAAYEPTKTLMGQELPHFINFAPQHHYVLQAALAQLNDWVRTGTPAPTAPPIDMTDGQLTLDAHGNATGGVRTPWIDVPAARTSGIGATEPLMAMLFGSADVFDAETLERLYPGGRAEYVDRFTQALDAAIGAGFLLAADRQEILDLAESAYPG